MQFFGVGFLHVRLPSGRTLMYAYYISNTKLIVNFSDFEKFQSYTIVMNNNSKR